MGGGWVRFLSVPNPHQPWHHPCTSTQNVRQEGWARLMGKKRLQTTWSFNEDASVNYRRYTSRTIPVWYGIPRVRMGLMKVIILMLYELDLWGLLTRLGLKAVQSTAQPCLWVLPCFRSACRWYLWLVCFSGSWAVSHVNGPIHCAMNWLYPLLKWW